MSMHPVRVFDTINGVASNADFTSEVLSTDGYKVLWLEITIDDASAPDYNVYVKGGLQGTYALLQNLTLVAGDVGEQAGVSLVTGFVQVDGSALAGVDAVLLVCIENPPLYVAVFGDHTGAGTTGARVTGRYWLQERLK